MSWESPITKVTNGLSMEIEKTIEGEVVKAVQKVGVVVDKAELLRALTYDRNQYNKGYEDRDGEIVRCRDCKHYRPDAEPEYERCRHHIIYMDPEDWCSYGERRES